VLVTANSDDPKMFQTSLPEEYRLLEQECGWSRDEIRRLILNAVEASWLSAKRKTALAAELTGSPAW
jgi:adenosine deaminase